MTDSSSSKSSNTNSKTAFKVLGLVVSTAVSLSFIGAACDEGGGPGLIYAPTCREPGDDRPCFNLPEGGANPEGGQTTDPPPPPPPPPPNNGDRGPLSATLRFEVGANFTPATQVFATFFAPKAPADEERISRERQEWDSESGYPTIAIGQCAVAPYLGPPPTQPLPFSAPGTTAIKQVDFPTMTLAPVGSGAYSAISTQSPFGAKLNLSIGAGADIAAAELTDLISVPPRVVLTMPAEPPALVTPNIPYTVAWQPLSANFFFLLFRQSRHVCKVDPMTGTFTIPGSVIQAQGLESPGVDLVAMNVNTAPITVGGARRSIDVRSTSTYRLPFRVQF